MGQRTCSVAECGKPPRSPRSDLCAMHYHRWYRHGDVFRTAKATTVTASHGRHYRMAYLPAHPIAGKNGKVYEHRAVLYDAIGAGEHMCHWCPARVQWEAAQHTPTYLTVDHLNGKTDDNRRANLVPSCLACNVTRGARARSSALRDAGWWSKNDTVAKLRGTSRVAPADDRNSP